MRRIYIMLITTMLLTGCTTSSSTALPTPTLAPIPTSETPNPLPEPTDPTQLVTVQTGERFDIVVPSNPSTGYRWDIIPGSGGVDVWTFRAVNVGDTTIMLGAYPPGNDNDPDEVFTFSIRLE